MTNQVSRQAAGPRKYGVLVVDDDPQIRDVLDFGLRQEGFAVWLASDGHEALDVYRTYGGVIDIALLDVRMPGLDGPRTLGALRAQVPNIPCCFMSGDFGTHSQVELYQRGARAVFHKPFLIGEVAQRLRDVITGDDAKAVSAAAEFARTSAQSDVAARV